MQSTNLLYLSIYISDRGSGSHEGNAQQQSKPQKGLTTDVPVLLFSLILTHFTHCVVKRGEAENRMRRTIEGEDRQIQWGKKVFSQPPIVQVLPLKKMRGL